MTLSSRRISPFTQVVASFVLCSACAADTGGPATDHSAASSTAQALVVPPSGTGSPGYTTSWWNFSSDPSAQYDSIEQMVVAQAESPVDAFYFSTTFYYHGRLLKPQPDYGPMGYMGLQATSHGKQAIFSMWGASSASSPGTAQPFDSEGTGFQTFVSYPWVANRAYIFRVTRTSKMYGAGSVTTAWTAYIKDDEKGDEKEIGTIKVPYTFGKLTNLVANFTEYFGDVRPCSEFLAMTPITVAFSRPSGNFGAVHDDSFPTSQTIQTDRDDRPTCDGAAAFDSSSSDYGVWATHRMFGQ